MYSALHTFAEFGISHINKSCEIKEAWVGCGCCRFDMCLFHCISARFSIISLSFWISQLLFQIIRTCVLQWMGAARGWMPDTYVPHRLQTANIYQYMPCPHCARQLNNVAYSCSPKHSVKATSPARKTRCVSGRMNAAVVMDTLELAVTLVRHFLSVFLPFASWLWCLNVKWIEKISPVKDHFLAVIANLKTA